MGPEMTDRWHADDSQQLRAVLAGAGVPPADVDAYLEVLGDRAALDAAMNWYRAAARSTGLRAADTPDVTVPVCYVWGDADQTVGRRAAELTVEHVTGPYRFVEVAGAGHFLTDDAGAATDAGGDRRPRQRGGRLTHRRRPWPLRRAGSSAIVRRCRDVGRRPSAAMSTRATGVSPTSSRANLRERREVGAACAVVRDGRLVVDLWGGHRDRQRTRPWQRDTLVSVFSTTKGLASMAMAVAHARGLFELDEPVATYWPEFAQHDKHDITVGCLLTHRAGLAVIDTPLDLATLGDVDGLGRVLAAQRPHWEPGRFHGYHGQSLGWYESQLLRRVDPQRRTIGRYFADEVARPLGIDFYIGLPDDVPDERLATFIGGGPARAALHLHQMPLRLVLGLCNPRSLTGRVFRNPKILARASDINRRDLLRLELPSVNGVGHARAIATAYGAFAGGADGSGSIERTLDLLQRRRRPPPGAAGTASCASTPPTRSGS